MLTAMALTIALIPCGALAADSGEAAGALAAPPAVASEGQNSLPEEQVFAQVSGAEAASGDVAGTSDAQPADQPQTDAPQAPGAEETSGDVAGTSNAQPADQPQTDALQVPGAEAAAGDTAGTSDAQLDDDSQTDSQQEALRQAAPLGTTPYEVGYPGASQTVEIPFAVFGDALNGRDLVSAQVLDGQGSPLAQLKGKKDNFRSVVVLTMPDDLDLTAGSYDLDFILGQSWTGTEQVVSGLAVLKVAQDIQGVHLINTEIRYDGTDQGTFTLKFQNGTGGNRIVSIDRVRFATRQEDGGATSTNLTQGNSGYTYDLDRGELYIPNAFFADRTLEPVVYFVGMDYTLANGQQITCTALELTPDQPVSSEGFVNPGDEAWYFLYQPPAEPDVQPCDLSYPGPNRTVEIPFDQFGDKLEGMDLISAQVLDDQGNPVARLEGKKDNFRSVVVLTMPWDLDLTAGTYDLRFLVGQSWTGAEDQLDGYATLTTHQDIQGVHLINSELRYDGTGSGSYVLRFRNGTGDNRITDLSRIRFMTRMEDGSTQGFGLRADSGAFTCDLEAGEITIPAASLDRQGLEDVVYFGMMDFTLANGETITANSLELVPDEAVRPQDFVNDGGEGWYLIPRTGVDLSGQITTAGQAGDVTLTLTRQGEDQPADQVTLSGQTGTTDYSMPQVAPGTYTLTVEKACHVSRDYTLTVGADPVEQDLELRLLGDVNGDGKVSTRDAAQVNAWVQGGDRPDDYTWACADVTGDGAVTTRDAAQINAHVRGLISLWKEREELQ